MSVLTDVLEEELERLQRHRKAILSDLETETSPRRRELSFRQLPRIEEDMIRIRRALAPIDEEV